MITYYNENNLTKSSKQVSVKLKKNTNKTLQELARNFNLYQIGTCKKLNIWKRQEKLKLLFNL